MFVQVQYVSVRVQYIDIYYHINIHIHINIQIYGQLHHISVQAQYISVRAQYISVRAQYISVRAHPHHSACARTGVFTLLIFIVRSLSRKQMSF